MGYGAPAGTPMAVRQRLATEIDKIVKSPEVTERLLSWGSEPVGGTVEDMERILAEERRRWSDVVRIAGIERE